MRGKKTLYIALIVIGLCLAGTSLISWRLDLPGSVGGTLMGSGSGMAAIGLTQLLMLRLIYEFNRLAGEALASYCDLEEILNCSCKEKIGRAKYIPEENIKEFDEIFELMNRELKAIGEGEKEDV